MITIEDILSRSEELLNQASIEANKEGLFLIKSAQKWIDEAKKRPIPQKIFSEFWLETELCILFADTNLGKSILAVQIANSITKGELIPGFKLETVRQPVLYFDYEMSDKQFENRYSENFNDHYHFDPYFYRVEINPEALIPEGKKFEDFLYESFEKAIVETGAKIIIIDNLTYLRHDNEKAKEALPLMKQLKALKNKYGLSILALAHTPKRDLTKPITRNDMQGSKMLINFCDSAFAIGESHADKSIRYLKQIKSRNTEVIYDTDNVCICQIEKPMNFLRFAYLCPGKEREHLKIQTDHDRDALVGKIKELKATGKSFRDIGNALGVSHMKVKRIWDDSNEM